MLLPQDWHQHCANFSKFQMFSQKVPDAPNFSNILIPFINHKNLRSQKYQYCQDLVEALPPTNIFKFMCICISKICCAPTIKQSKHTAKATLCLCLHLFQNLYLYFKICCPHHQASKQAHRYGYSSLPECGANY